MTDTQVMEERRRVQRLTGFIERLPDGLRRQKLTAILAGSGWRAAVEAMTRQEMLFFRIYLDDAVRPKLGKRNRDDDEED